MYERQIIVRHCRMKDGHAGVAIGSEVTGGCRNVWVENCTMDKMCIRDSSPAIKYVYRIKGLNDQWIELGNNRSASLVNVPDVYKRQILWFWCRTEWHSDNVSLSYYYIKLTADIEL